MYLGIDIGGSYIKYAYVNKEYEIVKHWSKQTNLCESKKAFYDFICEDVKFSDIEFIAVSAPGLIDESGNVNSKAAHNVEIMYQSNVIHELSIRSKLAVNVINDAKAAGYWELQKGNGRNTISSVYFIIGTGIGGCVCDANGVINGIDGMAGEFSQLPVYYQGEKARQMSEYSSMQALIQIYKRKSGKLITDGKAICEAYHQNDLHACEAMEEWCQNICHSLYTIILFYNPEVICIGGGISKEDWFIEKVKTTFESLKKGMLHLSTTRVERCKYNNNANLLGAVLYANNRNIKEQK